MKKQSNRKMVTHLLRAASLLVLTFLLVVQLIPHAVGQRQPPKVGKKSGAPTGGCPTPWRFVADMPQELALAAGASDDTYSYHAGGINSSFVILDTLYRYDPDAGSWTSLPPMPQAAAMPSAVYYPPTNRIYVFGGQDVIVGTTYDINRIYDIATNTWTTGTPMPDVRAFMASGYNPANDKIYLVGGYNTNSPFSAQPDTWEYDPVADTFTSKADFPHAAGGMASGVINGHLYVAGGRDAADEVINLTWDYDIAADTWTLKANMPGTQNNVRGSAVALERLWAFGGGNPFGPTYQGLTTDASAWPLHQAAIKDNPLVPLATNDAVVYDPVADSWSSAAPMNMQRPFTSGTAIGAKLIAAGGGSPLVPATASVEVLDACIPAPTPTPCPGDHYTIAAGTDILVPGDTDVGSHCDECDTIVTLPFPFQLYNGTFNSVSVSSNGRLDFVVPNEPGGYATSCLPASQGPNGPYDFTIFALWHDLTTETGLSGCSNFASGCGIFTSVSGNAPNRIFNIEFRTVRFDDNTQTQQFEVRLYENSPNRQFDVIYGPINGVTEFDTAGVQGDADAAFFTEDFCDTVAPQNVSRTYTAEKCASPSPIPRPTSTPRPRPTARPRPTP